MTPDPYASWRKWAESYQSVHPPAAEILALLADRDDLARTVATLTATVNDLRAALAEAREGDRRDDEEGD